MQRRLRHVDDARPGRQFRRGHKRCRQTHDIAEAVCTDILDEGSEKKFATDDFVESMTEEELGPYQFVFIQECDCMNGLMRELCRCLLSFISTSRVC